MVTRHQQGTLSGNMLIADDLGVGKNPERKVPAEAAQGARQTAAGVSQRAV